MRGCMTEDAVRWITNRRGGSDRVEAAMSAYSLLPTIRMIDARICKRFPRADACVCVKGDTTTAVVSRGDADQLAGVLLDTFHAA